MMTLEKALALLKTLREVSATYPHDPLFESERALVVVGDALAAAERERDGFRLACDQQADVLRTLRGLLQVEGDDAALVEQARRVAGHLRTGERAIKAMILSDATTARLQRKEDV